VVVKPGHPFKRGKFKGFLGFPGYSAVNQGIATLGLPVIQGLLQCIGHKVCSHGTALAPAHDSAGYRDALSPYLLADLTARSRTSGENLFDLFMTQSSQRFEPPQNTGRFTSLPLGDALNH
jgi:hypothetical protein